MAVAFLLALAATDGVAAAPLAPGIRAGIERFLVEQSAGLGHATVRVADPPAPLPPCALPQPFLPQGVQPWGHVSVGVRCASEHPWVRFVSADISIEGYWLVAAHPLQRGQALQAEDVEVRAGDLTKVPRTVVRTPADAEGLVAVNAVAAGAPLRSEMLRGAVVIRRGQAVRILAHGAGFVASTQGYALTDAAAGAPVQVRTTGGRSLSGMAARDGTVSLDN